MPVVSVQQRQRQGAQSVRQQWEQDWLVESIAEPQYGGAGTVQVLHVCVCVCLQGGSVKWSEGRMSPRETLLNEWEPFTAALRTILGFPFLRLV